MTALSSLIRRSMKICKYKLWSAVGLPGFVKIFSDGQQLNLEDQNRFKPLAKDGETKTPSPGTNKHKFISGLKFSSIR